MVHEALAELEQAKDYYQRALEIKIDVLDAKHIEVAKSYSHLGLVHKAWGELEHVVFGFPMHRRILYWVNCGREVMFLREGNKKDIVLLPS